MRCWSGLAHCFRGRCFFKRRCPDRDPVVFSVVFGLFLVITPVRLHARHVELMRNDAGAGFELVELGDEPLSIRVRIKEYRDDIRAEKKIPGEDVLVLDADERLGCSFTTLVRDRLDQFGIDLIADGLASILLRSGDDHTSIAAAQSPTTTWSFFTPASCNIRCVTSWGVGMPSTASGARSTPTRGIRGAYSAGPSSARSNSATACPGCARALGECTGGNVVTGFELSRRKSLPSAGDHRGGGPQG